MVSGGVDRTVRLWCLRLKTQLAIYKCHVGIVWCVDFNPSGYYFLSGSADGMVILWKTDVPNAQRVFVHGKDVYKACFAKDPSFVLSSGEDCEVKIWKVLTGELMRVLIYLILED